MRRLGEGPPLLMLAGTGGSGAIFLGLARRHKDRFAAVMPDPAPPFAPAESARALHQAMAEAGMGAYHVLGVSLGGCTAQQLAAQYPASVLSLTLCATFARMDAQTRDEIAALRDARLSLPDAAFLPRWLDALYGNTTHPVVTTLDTPPDVFAAQLDAAMAYDGTDALWAIRCLTRVTYGQADSLIPPRLSLALANGIAGAEAVAYPGSHMHWTAIDL